MEKVETIEKVTSLNKKKVCAYARVSFKFDEQESSLAFQLKLTQK